MWEVRLAGAWDLDPYSAHPSIRFRLVAATRTTHNLKLKYFGRFKYERVVPPNLTICPSAYHSLRLPSTVLNNLLFAVKLLHIPNQLKPFHPPLPTLRISK